MLVCKANTRLTRKGKIIRVISEHYLRDDIPCRCPTCPTCMAVGGEKEETDGKFSAVKARPLGSDTTLSGEPAFSRFIMLDATAILLQIDVLEHGAGLFDNVIVLQSVLSEVKTANLKVYTRFTALMKDATRRIVPFANDHFRETYVARSAGQALQDYHRSMFTTALEWLSNHFQPLGLHVHVVSDDATFRTQLEALPHVSSTLAVVRAAGTGFSNLAEMIAAVDDTAATSRKAGKSERPALFPEHWSGAKIAAGLKARACFQGTLRISRDCWFEARVAVHGISGKSDKENRTLAGGDDMVSVLILGRPHMNRAFDGDTVAIELLPRSQWRLPSARLSVKHGNSAEEDAKEEARILGALTANSDDTAATADDLRESLKAAAEARERGSVVVQPMPTGRVVGIVRRNWRQYCGSIEMDPATVANAAGAEDGGSIAFAVYFVPVDPRIPRIRLETRQLKSLIDKRFVVAVDAWDAYSSYPTGHYVRTMGLIGDKKTETDVILFEHDVATKPFSADVLACLPPSDWSITPENSRGRTDLRDIVVCSVDPPGCKDIDDALHARWLPDGSVEVGVHIADVSYFVKHGTAIDLEAASRANTTYLVERRLDMLPGLLTETLCSLKSNVDRFAFSVTWAFRPVTAGRNTPGEVLRSTSKSEPGILGVDKWEVVPGSVRYFKSIIHSRASLTYAQAQTMLDDPDNASAVGQGIKLLASVARSLRSARKAAGALTLASAEVKFMLDSETHEPLDVAAYELRETNSMVEEFMLLANVYVAQRTVESYPRYSMLRRHPAPPKRQYDALLAAASAVGVSIKVDTSKDLADSLDAAVVTGNPFFNRLLRILATRCMMQATYFCSGQYTPSEYHHYGLAAPIYTHFTSPIRRYADVIVHRLLSAAIDVDPLPTAYEDRQSMKVICDNMNKRHLMSQLAGRASAALHTNIFFRNRVIIESGLVMRLKANGVVLLVPRFGLETTIILNEEEVPDRGKSGNAWDAWVKETSAQKRALCYDETTQHLYDKKDSELSIRIFDEVRVAVFVAEYGPQQKELAVRIIEPAFHDGLRKALPAHMSIDDATKGRPLARNNVVAPAALRGTELDDALEGQQDGVGELGGAEPTVGSSSKGSVPETAAVGGKKRPRGEPEPVLISKGKKART